MREEMPEEPNDDRDSDEDGDETKKKRISAPTRAGSNVPNAGRDPDEGRTE
jgi:hypothetical protein